MRVIQSATVWWVGPAVILTMIAGPDRLAAQEQQAPSTSMQGHQMMQDHMVSPDLMIPSMNPTNGRKLFASKGCVVCHSVNGVGGTDAAPLDASTMSGMINPFEFVASMWRGAGQMIELQQKELGFQIEFTGRELGDIIAFVHHVEEQKKFSEADIPPDIRAAIARMEQGEGEEGEGSKNEMDKMKMKPDAGASGN